MLVRADEMIYDYDLDEVTASGNVEIYYGAYALTADKVVYSKREDTVTAIGNARLREPNGNIVFSPFIKVSGDFREGFINSLAVLTPEDARIAAASAERTEGNVIVFKNAAYTACKVDTENPEKAPIWQIKAVTVIHNQQEQTIEYRDVTFEFSGIPIAYVPYFKHPDPTVKRKSGFLAPVFDLTNQLGFSVETPYFFALAPNYDLTISPRITTKQGVLLKGEWRHRLIDGSYYIRPAGIYQTDPTALPAPGNRRWRGSIQSAGEFRINEYWTWGWDVTAASDRTFLRAYDLLDEAEYVSNLHLTGISGRNYFDVRAMHLEDDATPATFTDPVFGLLPVGTPIDPATGAAFIAPGVVPLTAPDEALVHPVLDYNYLFDQQVAGGELGFNLSAYSLTRDIGADSSRIVGELTWRRTMTDSWGQQFTPFANLRGDVYFENEVYDPTTVSGVRGAETVARVIPTAGLQYQYPFISVHDWGMQVIEPIAQIVARPDERHANQISNEDAWSLVFDDTLLFEPDKFSGYDRTESGTRANVGVRYTVQTNDWGYGSVLLGQSFHLAGTNTFDAATGLGGTNSDVVGAIYLEPSDNFGFSSQFRLDDSNLSVRRHELKGWVREGPFYGALTYAKFDEDPTPITTNDREEILAKGSLNLTDEWRLFGQTRYNLSDKQRVQNGIGIGYFCDCMTVRFDYIEDFFSDGDDQPNRIFKFKIDLKTLGGTTISTRTSNTETFPLVP